MKKYAIIQPKAYVVLALAILMLAIGANLVFAHTSSVGLMSPSLIVYAGEDGWSQTISVSITGGLLIPEECQDCYICVNVGGLSFTESLSDQNAYTRTLHKSDMGDVLPGVYPVSWYIHWEDANTETLFSTDVLFNPFSGYPICLRPVSVNKADKKVTYSTNINTGRYTGIYDELEHTPLTSLCYSAYAPDLTPVPSSTVITVPSGEDSFLSNLIVEYTKTDRDHAGYQIWLAAECAYAMRTRPPVWMFSQRVGDFYSNTERNITYSAACTTCVTETPHFYLTKVMTSTTTNPETSPYQNAIEPVYSDSVTYRWQRTYNEFHAKAIALYQEYDNDAEGRFKFGDKYYEEILHSSVDINDSQITSDIDLGAQTQKLTAEGEVTWTAKDASENTVTIFPAGHHRVGIKYSDADGDNVELA
ncbi:MAG: hypothetical protein NT018_10220, partial [Armatimonadetes bacterium]|nr:hypothetical protein [Armatimonadota bacterium]